MLVRYSFPISIILLVVIAFFSRVDSDQIFNDNFSDSNAVMVNKADLTATSDPVFNSKKDDSILYDAHIKALQSYISILESNHNTNEEDLRLLEKQLNTIVKNKIESGPLSEVSTLY